MGLVNVGDGGREAGRRGGLRRGDLTEAVQAAPWRVGPRLAPEHRLAPESGLFPSVGRGQLQNLLRGRLRRGRERVQRAHSAQCQAGGEPSLRLSCRRDPRLRRGEEEPWKSLGRTSVSGSALREEGGGRPCGREAPGRLRAAGWVTGAPARGRKVLRADGVTRERWYSQREAEPCHRKGRGRGRGGGGRARQGRLCWVARARGRGRCSRAGGLRYLSFYARFIPPLRGLRESPLPST